MKEVNEEEKMKVVILSDEDSCTYEIFFAKKNPLTFLDNFKTLQECLDYCKERDFVIASDFEK